MPRATGEKTRRAGCRGRTAASGLSLVETAEPAAGHAAGLVDLHRDEEELLPGDPAALMDDAPENAKFFECEIETGECLDLGWFRAVGGLDATLHSIEREAVDPLAEGEPLAAGKRCGPVERPPEQVTEVRVQGRR